MGTACVRARLSKLRRINSPFPSRDRSEAVVTNIGYRARFRSRRQIAEALETAHAKGIVHRDLFRGRLPRARLTRYSVEENFRAGAYAELARGGTGFEEMGELLYQAHWAYSEMAHRSITSSPI